MKAILFDIYGTLIDIHTDEEKSIFWENLAFETKKFKKYSVSELKYEYLRICDELSLKKEEIDILDVFSTLFEVNYEKSNEIAKIFRRLSTEYIKLYRGVKSLLKSLKKAGYKLFILSNAQSSFTIPELENLGIIKYFDGIAISSDYGVKKPNHKFYLKAIENFNLDREIFMIGNDYECDVKPALELGLKSIFIETNLTSKNKYVKKILGFNYHKILEEVLNSN